MLIFLFLLMGFKAGKEDLRGVKEGNRVERYQSAHEVHTRG